jgi:ATP-dependent DNA ligase
MPHDPPQNGVLNSDSRQKVRKTVANTYLWLMFKAFEFCIPTQGTKVPAGPEWLHEIKQDGFRIRVERDRDRVRLITSAEWQSARRR